MTASTPSPTAAPLARPLLPLARLIEMLFLTGPFATMAELLPELPAPMEVGELIYDQPAALLTPFLDLLEQFAAVRDDAPLPARVLGPDDTPLDRLSTLELLVNQEILSRELEPINSALCAPCGCTLCCTGPAALDQQDFFEIPLTTQECSLFPLDRIDTPASRATTPFAESALHVHGQPFYTNPTALYHWQNGWGLVLPRDTHCPHLDAGGRCRIYPHRPKVCRRPQLFAYILEPHPAYPAPLDQASVFRRRDTLLAIWDCPYVRQHQEAISRFAELAGITPLFKKNKA